VLPQDRLPNDPARFELEYAKACGPSLLDDTQMTAQRAGLQPVPPHLAGTLDDLAQTIMRQRFDPMIVASGHGVIID
jgi:hypothetical protein